MSENIADESSQALVMEAQPSAPSRRSGANVKRAGGPKAAPATARPGAPRRPAAAPAPVPSPAPAARARSARAGGAARAEASAPASNAPRPRAQQRTARPARNDAAANPERLRRELRDFASARPQGWGHEDWINFLESLQGRGYNIHDRDAIGAALERERLDLALSRVRGLGPQRRRALVERFGQVWALRNANPAEIAEAARIPVDLAAAARDASAN
ncbi:MAG: hypothetical protein LBG44_09150 [Gemmatimonadota bacterium]|jgi:hypothetical protein|nr:hypothetical protein [Gemmatimonadota bacterium]